MVDITARPATAREAVARVELRMRPETLAAISGADLPKGDVLAAATIAGIAAAKRTWDLIPLCHHIPLAAVDISFATRARPQAAHRPARLIVTATARTHAATGAEMEALTAAAVAALTVYDMCKAREPGMEIASLRLVRKSGGKSGTWQPSAQ
jgi:cyclic pyranopterin phosphate synthase